MYFPFYKNGMSQVVDRQDDGVPVSANFPRPNEKTEKDGQCDEASSQGTSTKKRKQESDHFEVQPKLNQHLSINHSDGMRKSPLPYIGMIAEAINSSPYNKMVLSEIYIYMEQHFFQYLSGKPRWRNTVRHNLSFHKCFVKCECSRRGNRSHFWTVHPDYIEQFKRGNFTKTLSPPREPLNLTSHCINEHQSLRRNPREQFNRFYPNLYENYIHYEPIPPPMIPSYGSPSASNVLHPLTHHELRSLPVVPSSPRSRIPQQFPTHEGNQRLFPSAESVLSQYQFPHLVPLPWQYQHLQMPGSAVACARQQTYPDYTIPTTQNSPNQSKS